MCRYICVYVYPYMHLYLPRLKSPVLQYLWSSNVNKLLQWGWYMGRVGLSRIGVVEGLKCHVSPNAQEA